MRKNILYFLIIIMTIGNFGCISIKFNPWKDVTFYEKNLISNSTGSNTSNLISYVPFINNFNQEIYSDYYIDDLFIGILSQKATNVEGGFHREEWGIFIKLYFQAINKNKFEKIIIHNIELISENGINYSSQIEEFYPLEIEVLNISDRVMITKYDKNVINTANTYVEQISGDKLFIRYDGPGIKVIVPEIVNCYIDIEVIKTDMSNRRIINFIMVPNIIKGVWRITPLI